MGRGQLGAAEVAARLDHPGQHLQVLRGGPGARQDRGVLGRCTSKLLAAAAGGSESYEGCYESVPAGYAQGTGWWKTLKF